MDAYSSPERLIMAAPVSACHELMYWFIGHCSHVQDAAVKPTDILAVSIALRCVLSVPSVHVVVTELHPHISLGR